MDAGDEQTAAECEAVADTHAVDQSPLPTSHTIMDALALFLRLTPADRDLVAWRLTHPRDPLASYARMIGMTKQAVSISLKTVVAGSEALKAALYPANRRQTK
jgi:hypothetical protein